MLLLWGDEILHESPDIIGIMEALKCSAVRIGNVGYPREASIHRHISSHSWI